MIPVIVKTLIAVGVISALLGISMLLVELIKIMVEVEFRGRGRDKNGKNS